MLLVGETERSAAAARAGASVGQQSERSSGGSRTGALKWASGLWLGLLALVVGACAGKPFVQPTWAVYYGIDAAPELLQGYSLVVLDPGFAGDLKAVKAKGAKVLAYLSLGEINEQRQEFAQAKSMQLLLEANPNWPGARAVDIRDARWRAIIVQSVASSLLARGFDGLFLDTIDSSLWLEKREPARFTGMMDAAVTLISGLHAASPSSILVMNGGLELAGRLRGTVDRIAIESTLSTWDFVRKEPRWRSGEERADALRRIAAAKVANPKLQVYALDYWDPEDRASIATIYRSQRKAGLVPYVATIALDRVIAEPVIAEPVVAEPSAAEPAAAAPPVATPCAAPKPSVLAP